MIVRLFRAKYWLLLLAVFMAACSQNKQLDYSVTTDFSRYQRYQVRLDRVEDIYRFFDSENIVRSRLSAKGLVAVTAEEGPDFFVDLSISYAGEDSLMTLGFGLGNTQHVGSGSVGLGVSSGVPLGVKSVAHVEIRMLDGETGKLFWRNAEQVRYKGEEEKQQAIYEAIEILLTSFPPEKS
jgi:hypothetical protein